jgi:hypothetical protein
MTTIIAHPSMAETNAIPARSSPFADLIGGPPEFQVAWDSTSLGLFKECARKYQYEIIMGWRSPGMNVHLTFGLGYHAAMEAYDHAVFAGADHQQGLRAALRTALSTGGRMDDLDQWQPWRSTDHYKNLWTLCRSVVWYLDHFRSNPLKTVELSNGKPAVELSFYIPVEEMNGLEIGLCGHMDRVVDDPDGKRVVHDRKTTKSALSDQYYAGFNPHGQFAQYTFAANVVFNQPALGIVVDAAQVGVNFSRFGRRFISFPRATVDEWFQESMAYISIAYQYAERGFWPRNDKSCGNYGGCAFRKVCSISGHHRQSWLEQDFKPFRWNPLQVRGDI